MPDTRQPNEAAFLYYPRLTRVREFVLHHYREPLTLAEVARVAGMERTAFSRYFHRRAGVCYRDWLAGIRVSRAKELMASRDLPLARVAHESGYGNIRTFQRAFLRVCGRTAADYKSRVRP